MYIPPFNITEKILQDAVFYEMSSRFEYINYLRAKFERLKDSSNPIGVQIGRMDGTNDFALLLTSRCI